MCSVCFISSVLFQGASILVLQIVCCLAAELYGLANAELSSCANGLERDGCKFNCGN